ncbi:MAG TPA: phosphotransferase [Ilumatobacter sp.]|nr:phosphotransferase [Ilumatobacter sp.]
MTAPEKSTGGATVRHFDVDDVCRRLGGVLLRTIPLLGGVASTVTGVEVGLPDGTVRRVVVRQPGTAAWRASKPQTARKEFGLLAYLAGVGLPVPRPLLLDEGSPSPFYVMEFADGVSDLPPDGVEQMADLLARLHATPIDDGLSLPDREDPVAGLLRLLDADRVALRARLVGRPITLTPRRSIVHGDYWPENVLWRDGAIAALIDWEDAAIGDPLVDLACGRLELRYVLGTDGADRFTARYAEQTDHALDELPVSDAYVSAAALASVGHWGVPADKEALIRREAEAVLTASEAVLLR